MTDEQSNFRSWAIVEVMGHQRLAGLVTQQAIGGCAFVRVDVPATTDRPAFTKLLGGASIFSLTPCDEATARRAAEQFRAEPLVLFDAGASGLQRRLGYQDDSLDQDDARDWDANV